jgi:hypothetical protein
VDVDNLGMYRLVIALASFLAGCGLGEDALAPSECGFPSDAIVAWSGVSSLEELDIPLSGPDGVSPSDQGDAFITQPGPDGDRNYCIVYYESGQAQWFVSGVLPPTWDSSPP